MDLVALRDHSEKELRTKLRAYFRRNFLCRQRLAKKQGRDLNEEFAKSHNWICQPDDLAEKVARMLHHKNKGISYINNYLNAKGLPCVPNDQDLELEKALALVKNKYSYFFELPLDEKKKKLGPLARFLGSRGFDSETVRKVIYGKL